MATPTVYAICENKCLYETMTKEEILAAIAQAVNEGTIGECDTGFVQTIKTINGVGLKFFVGTQAEYEGLSEEDKQDLFAIITNDTTKDGLFDAINTLQTELVELETKLTNGSVVVNRAAQANYATNAGTAAKLATDPFPAPTSKIELSTASGAYGYYYIYAYDGSNYLNFGVMYWNGKDRLIGSFFTGLGYAYKLQITGSTGKLALMRAQVQSDSSMGTYTNITSSSTIYVAHIGA